MSITKEQYQEIYENLNQVSPVDFDCGVLCGSVCCGCDIVPDEQQEELGIFLMPGEEAMLEGDSDWLDWKTARAEDVFFPWSWRGTNISYVRCKDPHHCHRAARSIQCRTFPVEPHILDDGRLSLIYNDMELPYQCPLIEQQVSLNCDFLEATWNAWNTLLEDPRIRDLVMMNSDDRRPYIEPEDILFAKPPLS